MASLRALILRARESAEYRGHSLARFTHNRKTQAYAYCETGCGMGAFVDTKPAPNGIDISGRAVAVNCPNREVTHAETPRTVRVVMESEVYGADTFGPYDSPEEAAQAIDRLKESAAALKDGVERRYTVEDAE
jgi:hypothetical protein